MICILPLSGMNDKCYFVAGGMKVKGGRMGFYKEEYPI
jgi:hypothetical protein